MTEPGPAQRIFNATFAGINNKHDLITSGCVTVVGTLVLLDGWSCHCTFFAQSINQHRLLRWQGLSCFICVSQALLAGYITATSWPSCAYWLTGRHYSDNCRNNHQPGVELMVNISRWRLTP
ncbi:hypothetical protein ACLK19_13385 [Escherichia coli]